MFHFTNIKYLATLNLWCNFDSFHKNIHHLLLLKIKSSAEHENHLLLDANGAEQTEQNEAAESLIKH